MPRRIPNEASDSQNIYKPIPQLVSHQSQCGSLGIFRVFGGIQIPCRYAKVLAILVRPYQSSCSMYINSPRRPAASHFPHKHLSYGLSLCNRFSRYLMLQGLTGYLRLDFSVQVQLSALAVVAASSISVARPRDILPDASSGLTMPAKGIFCIDTRPSAGIAGSNVDAGRKSETRSMSSLRKRGK